MDTVHGLWLMVATELTLFGLFWLAMAGLQPRPQRGGILALAAFNLVKALGLILIEERGHLPGLLTYPGANILQLFAVALLWHGGALHLRGTVRKEPFIVWGVASLVMAAAYLWWPDGNLRVTALFVASCWIFLRASWLAGAPLRARGPFGARMAWALRLIATLAACGLAWRIADAHLTGEWLDLDNDTAGSQLLAFGLLVGLTIANVALAYAMVRGLMRELERLATADPLTGLFNRRAFWNSADKRWAEWQRQGRPFAVVCFDIDHFKSVNDSYGHAAGDKALQLLARLLGEHARPRDDVGRMGGEEFTVLLGDAEATDQALAAAERMRRAVEAAEPPPELQGRRLTVSAGVALVAANDASPAQVMERADQALYAAKQGGRNRTCLAA